MIESSNIPYPLGLNLGPTYITASHALDEGSIVSVTRITASLTYQNFFQQILQKRVQNELQLRPQEHLPDSYLFPPESQAEELSAILTHEIEAIKLGATRTLGSTVIDVKSISIPYHWNSTAQQAMLCAARVANIPLAGRHMLRRYPRALDMAYNLESNLAADSFLFLVVDYNRSYLQLLTCESAKDGGYGLVEGQVQLPHLGEDAVSKGEPGQHYQRIFEALEEFNHLTATKDPSPSIGRLPYHDIKAVVLGGEASLEAMRLMHDVLQQTFADLGKGVLFDSLDPLYLGSMGAARVAKS